MAVVITKLEGTSIYHALAPDPAGIGSYVGTLCNVRGGFWYDMDTNFADVPPEQRCTRCDSYTD